jgi:hypothetical protein
MEILENFPSQAGDLGIFSNQNPLHETCWMFVSHYGAKFHIKKQYWKFFICTNGEQRLQGVLHLLCCKNKVEYLCLFASLAIISSNIP